MNWLSDNWADILTALAAVHVLALFVANLTPTPKDNAFIEKVYSGIMIAAGLVTKEAKGTK